MRFLFVVTFLFLQNGFASNVNILEFKDVVQVKEALRLTRHSAPLKEYYTVLETFYDLKAVKAFKENMKKYKVSENDKLPEVSFRKNSLFVEGLPHPLKIINRKELKFQYNGLAWQFNQKVSLMKNIESLIDVLGTTKTANFSFFQKAYAEETSPMSWLKNSTYALAATAVVGTGIAVLASGPVLAGTGFYLAIIAGSWAIVSASAWLGSEAMESIRSGGITPTCVNGKLRFRTNRSTRIYSYKELAEKNEWLESKDRETLERQMNGYNCKPSWVRQYVKALNRTLGLDSAQADQSNSVSH